MSTHERVADALFERLPYSEWGDAALNAQCECLANCCSIDEPDLIGKQLNYRARAYRSAMNNSPERRQQWLGASEDPFLATDEQCEFSLSAPAHRPRDRTLHTIDP